MESKTFTYRDQLALTVQPGAVKAMTVQDNGAFVTVEVRGTGLLKLGLDLPKLLGEGKHDLVYMNDVLVNAVFRLDDSVPVVSMVRIVEGDGKDDDGALPTCPVPIGPTIK